MGGVFYLCRLETFAFPGVAALVRYGADLLAAAFDASARAVGGRLDDSQREPPSRRHINTINLSIENPIIHLVLDREMNTFSAPFAGRGKPPQAIDTNV